MIERIIVSDIIVLVAFMRVVFIVIGAIAADVAYVQLVNTQLRRTAYAAAEALARTQDVESAIEAAQAVALENAVMGTPFELDDSEIGLDGRGRVRTSLAISTRTRLLH